MERHVGKPQRATLPLSASSLETQAGIAFKLAHSYDVLDRPADALAAQNQALAIWRDLSDYAPRLYTKGYATSLHEACDLYWKRGRHVAVRILLRQALSLYRRRYRADAEEDRQSLAILLHDLGTGYGTSWATADRAVPQLWEALRWDAGLGMSSWWINHFEPHMRALLDPVTGRSPAAPTATRTTSRCRSRRHRREGSRNKGGRRPPAIRSPSTETAGPSGGR